MNERRVQRTAVRAWLLAGAALLVIGPAIAIAADPTPSPSPDVGPVSAQAAESPSPTPSPTLSPTLSPTPDPTPSPTPDPTATATPDPTPTADPTPTPTPAPTPRIESILIYRRSAIVRQYTDYWCVPAATQTMWNLISNDSNATHLRQSVLYRQIQLHNRYHYMTNGNDVEGWAWALRRWTYKPYVARAYLSKSVAIASIVEAIDRTHHPVGVTVKSGTHAWVVIGYRLAVDPVDSTKRTIQGFYVTGPMGGSPDPFPYRYMTLSAFNKIYTRYHEWQRKVVWEGLYVVVND